MFIKSCRVWLCAVVAVAMLSTGSFAEDLLVVDLSVTNQVTVFATTGLSAATVTGSDSTGVYFEDFYGVAGVSLSATLVSGNLTNAQNPPDNSPALYRSGSGSDPGLNIYSWSPDSNVTFTAGSLAFVGSGTWTVSSAAFTDMINGARSGNLYFPADSVDDIPTASLLGTYSVYVPEPSSMLLLSLGLVMLRRR